MRKFGKKTAATIVMLLGAIIFALEVTVLSLDGTPGLIITIISAFMTIGGVIALGILNRNKGEAIADTFDVGTTIIEVLLGIFFDS